jgi:hypothetical protein
MKGTTAESKNPQRKEQENPQRQASKIRKNITGK